MNSNPSDNQDRSNVNNLNTSIRGIRTQPRVNKTRLQKNPSHNIKAIGTTSQIINNTPDYLFRLVISLLEHMNILTPLPSSKEYKTIETIPRERDKA